MDRPANLVAAFQQVFAGRLSFVHTLGPRVLTIELSMAFRWFQPQVNPEISCRAAHMVMEHQVLGRIDLGPSFSEPGNLQNQGMTA